MRLRHFEALRPVCPVCRDPTFGASHPLRITSSIREESETILEGTLGCSNPLCQREYPILDGIPLLVPAIRPYIGENILSIGLRNDLSEASESLIGDACGPGSAFDTLRQQLSSYAWDHYAEFDPLEPSEEPRPGSLARLLMRGLGTFSRQADEVDPISSSPSDPVWPGLSAACPGTETSPFRGTLRLAPATREEAEQGVVEDSPIIDVGCSVGRTTFELAERSGALTLGIDLNHAMLRLAAETLRSGIIRYSRRRVGVVYDRREFPVPFAHRDRVDFWACDASALPFEPATFAGATCLNVLDSTHSPAELLHGIARAVRTGGEMLIGCPYDWAASATPIEGWLGGHSQRGAYRGASEPVLRDLLTPGAHPWSLSGVSIESEIDRVPWNVRLHDRSLMAYQVHLIAARIR